MSTRWDREFRRANVVRLDELHKVLGEDPSHDPARLQAARDRIDELEAPEVAALEARFERRMAKIADLTAQLSVLVLPLYRANLLRLLFARPALLHFGTGGAVAEVPVPSSGSSCARNSKTSG